MTFVVSNGKKKIGEAHDMREAHDLILQCDDSGAKSATIEAWYSNLIHGKDPDVVYYHYNVDGADRELAEFRNSFFELQQFRTIRGTYGQLQLAQMLGIPVRTIENWDTNTVGSKRECKPYMKALIAHALYGGVFD